MINDFLYMEIVRLAFSINQKIIIFYIQVSQNFLDVLVTEHNQKILRNFNVKSYYFLVYGKC